MVDIIEENMPRIAVFTKTMFVEYVMLRSLSLKRQNISKKKKTNKKTPNPKNPMFCILTEKSNNFLKLKKDI